MFSRIKFGQKKVGAIQNTIIYEMPMIKLKVMDKIQDFVP
jgi:hypothetical protein